MAKFIKGQTPWNKGRPHTDEVKKKMSLKLKGRIVWSKGKTVGEDHHNWKGGVSRGYRTGYYSNEYKNWRKAVFERDGFTCQECGDMGYVTAHHIKSFAHYPDLRYEISNGKTLCESCHEKTDNYKGRNKGKKLLALTKL